MIDRNKTVVRYNRRNNNNKNNYSRCISAILKTIIRLTIKISTLTILERRYDDFDDDDGRFHYHCRRYQHRAAATDSFRW